MGKSALTYDTKTKKYKIRKDVDISGYRLDKTGNIVLQFKRR